MLLTINLAVKLSLAADNNQKVCWFFNVSWDPESALKLTGLDFVFSWVPQLSTTWLSWWVDLGRGMPCHVMLAILTLWNDWRMWTCPVMLLKAHCYFGCACSFHVLGKAAGREQPDHPEVFASPIALPSRCQKAPPERGQQKNAIDNLLMKDGRAGASLVCGVLSEVREHYPNLGCYLGSLFCGIATWGLSRRRSLLGLPPSPEVPLQRICASISLHYC